MPRHALVVGNWKMNPETVDDAVALARAVAGRALPEAVEVAVAPPFVALPAVAQALSGSRVATLAQDVHWEERGAFTGAIAASMLRGHASGAIVGHSEVRRDQGDDDTRVGRKLARALEAGLRAVLCVGEDEAEFLQGDAVRVVERQLAIALAAARGADATRLVVAYEPVWAIGTGRPATGAHATAAARTIRQGLARAGLDAESVRVLYGGSVSADGVGEFASAEGVDGALVGGASLRADEFAAIVSAFA